MKVGFPLYLSALTSTAVSAWVPQWRNFHAQSNTARFSTATADSLTWFSEAAGSASLEKTKAQVLQLGAALDRGQSYNPTSGAYYEGTMEAAKEKIKELVGMAVDSNLPSKLEDMEGEWELVLSTVPHGIFRSR